MAEEDEAVKNNRLASCRSCSEANVDLQPIEHNKYLMTGRKLGLLAALESSGSMSLLKEKNQRFDS